MKQKVRDNIVVITLIFLTLILTLLFQNFGMKEYSRYSTDTLHYEKAKVVEVSDEDVEYDEGLGMYLGKQVLQVEMLEGEEKPVECELKDTEVLPEEKAEEKTEEKVGGSDE